MRTRGDERIMKSTQEMSGLRIISISDGTQVGHIKDVVLNPKGGTLDFIMIDQPSDYLGAKVIAFSDITGLGEFALTIPDTNVIQDVAQNLAVQELLKQNIHVIGTKVLTKSGKLSGEVQEILIDEESGKIAVCQVALSNGEGYDIDASQVITYGKELLIVEAETTTPTTNISNTINTTTNIANTASLSALENSEGLPPESYNVESSESSVDKVEDESAGFNLFEQRQLQYFVGKAVEKEITLDNGEILRVGDLMTADTVGKIKTRSTLMEITSHLRKQ